MKLTVLAALAIAAVGFAMLMSNPERAVAAEGTESGPQTLVEVKLPTALSGNAKIGKAAFEAKCVSCHGANAAGLDGLGPPLVHKIYEPSHHADEAFQRAVALGVRSHHWRFGNMAPVEGLTRGDVAMIVAYVRELQRENGIE